MSDWKAKEAARAAVAAALQAAHPHLIPVGQDYGKNDSLNAAAKNMRIELKRAFPGVKFSVTSSRFSGGESIRVRWTDGPNGDQVDAIIDRYSAGSCDGMEDIYNYSRSAWTDAFGSAKYVNSERENSPAAIASAIRTASARYGCPPPSVEDYKAGKCRDWHPDGMLDMQSRIYQVMSKRTWCLTRAPARAVAHKEAA